MEFSLKNNAKQNSMFSLNNKDKYYIRISNTNKKNIINFNKISKNNWNILKKKKEFAIYKRQKHNSIKRRIYIYNVIYNKIFIILDIFMLFFFISSSKQSSDLSNLKFMQKIIITIGGPDSITIFSNNFRYQPSALYINGKEINLEQRSYYNTFNLKEEENIIKVYYSNPPDSFKNMFNYNYYVKKVDLTDLDTSKVKDMNSMFANCVRLEYVNMTGIDTSSVTDMSSMFQSCPKLTSLDLSSYDTSSVLSMKCMFCHSKNLAYLNISNFNTTLVNIMSEMFSYCDSLELLDLSSFETNKDLDMSKMFYNCSKLKTIKFPEKKKIYGLNMEYLFQGCSSLTSLNLSRFDTSFTKSFNNMFENCINLISIDLSNFNTSKVINMNSMFKGCSKLEFLDLSNFDTNFVNSMEGMFKSCSSLIYLNMKSLVIDNSINTNYIFSGCSDKLILCYEKEYEQKLTRDVNIINNCSDICFSDTKKIITELNKCVEKCNTSNSEYKYEYNNKCYKECPNNQICKNIVEEDIITQKILVSTDYEIITEDLTPQVTQNVESQSIETIKIKIPTNEAQKITEELTFQITHNTENTSTKTNLINIPTISDIQKVSEEIIDQTNQNIESLTNKIKEYNIPTISDTQNIGNNWNSSNFFIGLIEERKLNISKDDIINNIKEDIINHKIDYLLSNVTEGNKEDLYIKDEDVLYQITTTDNQNNNNYNNISKIKLGECENILKKIYNIDRNLSLIIFKIDYYLEGLLIPIIGYEVYHPENKSKLNLSYCNETLISYNIPVSIDENNLFKYDQNSEYYNDECNTYTTEDGTDILINDRKEEFIQNNMSLCENICTYTGYDKNTKKALCECGIKYKEFILSEIEKQTDLLSNNLTTDDISNSNLVTMKCYETLFSKDGLLTNIGSYILLL